MKLNNGRRWFINPALIVALVAMGFVVFAFTKNANPYVSFTEAKTTRDDRLHVVGDVVPGTVHRNIFDHTLTFEMTDLKGTRCSVTHRGEIPNNIDELKRVVVIGKMVGEGFVSQQMQMKCPSRYDDKVKPGAAAQGTES